MKTRKNQTRTHLVSQLRRSDTRIGIIIFGFGFALIGLVLIHVTRASSTSISIEPESGSLSSVVTKVTDATASNSQAIKFGTAAAGGTADCDTYPKLPAAKPIQSNTGIPAGTTLATYTGPMTITTDGTVIDSKIITDTLTINANNVTIKNSRIHATGYYGITTDSHTNVRIIHNELYAGANDIRYTGFSGGSAFICGNYIHGFENGLTVGDSAMIQANFIEKLDSSSSSAHYDGIEVYSGSNTKIWGNNILVTDANGAWLGETGAVNVTATWSDIANVQLNGNWLGGGSFTLNLDEQYGYHVTNLSVTNNRWYGAAPTGYAAYGPIRAQNLITTFTGNVWDTSNSPI